MGWKGSCFAEQLPLSVGLGDHSFRLGVFVFVENIIAQAPLNVKHFFKEILKSFFVSETGQKSEWQGQKGCLALHNGIQEAKQPLTSP